MISWFFLVGKRDLLCLLWWLESSDLCLDLSGRARGKRRKEGEGGGPAGYAPEIVGWTGCVCLGFS